MDVRYHCIRQEVDRDAIVVAKVSTEYQAANGLTKSLDRAKHENFTYGSGIVDCHQVIASHARF
jgi:hypothetical protein